MRDCSCFFMVPFNVGWDTRLLEAISNAAGMVRDCKIHVDRADLADPLNIGDLESNIRMLIEQADFGIAEVSDRNPNVMIEIGLAIGRDKPVILMARTGLGVPSDVRGRYWFEYDPDKLEAVPRRLATFMRSAVDEALAAGARPRYPVTAYGDRDSAPIREAIESADSQILLTTTNLDWFFETGVVNCIALRLDTTKFVTRILVLEPESEYAADRARQLSLAVYAFRNQLRTSLERTAARLKGYGDWCKIATYSEFPTQITLIVDQTVYSVVVSANRRGRDNVVVALPLSHTGVSESFLGHIRTVWERSELLGGGKPGPLL